MYKALGVVVLMQVFSLFAWTQGGRAGEFPPGGKAPVATGATGATGAARDIQLKDEPPVVTHHEIRVGGKVLKYTATTGMMPSKEENDEIQANLFYVAYTLDTETPREK